MDCATVLCLLLLACLGCCAHAKANAPGIYYGEPVDITEVPFMARIHRHDYLIWCGAVIVHEQFVISAAHCLDNDTVVGVGSSNIYSGLEQDYEIEKSFIHPKYNHSMIDYDLMVVKLKKKLTLSDRVRPIKMADPDLVIQDGEMMDTMGFGGTQDNDYSPQLLKIDVPLYNQEKCKEYMRKNTELHVTESMICAGGVGKKEACNGDSGGPLRYKDMVVGLISWAWLPCVRLNNPDVYSRISIMRPFIDEVIRNNS